jgi:hypothetical protein
MCAVADVELGVDALDVRAHGFGAKRESFGDLSGAAAGGELLEHALFGQRNRDGLEGRTGRQAGEVGGEGRVDSLQQGVSGTLRITVTPEAPPAEQDGRLLLYSFRAEATLDGQPLGVITNAVRMKLPVDTAYMKGGWLPWLWEWTTDDGRRQMRHWPSSVVRRRSSVSGCRSPARSTMRRRERCVRA